jgi:signal transduction histidine kinase
MKIRTKLVLLSVCISGLIIVLSSIAIYYSSTYYRRQVFYDRLNDKADAIANALAAAKIDTSKLAITISESPVLREQKTLILDDAGKVVFKNGNHPFILATPAILENFKVSQNIEFNLNDSDGLGRIITVKEKQYKIILSAYDKYGLIKIVNLRLVLFIVSVVSILASIVSGWFFVTVALRPIERIISEVDTISASNLHQRVSEGNGKDEIANLAQRFNKMLQRLENAFEAQRNFVSNASHELRTPLTTISSQIDVTLLKERSKDEYKGILVSVREEMMKLNELANRLLDLAEVSMDKEFTNFKMVRIDEILWQARSELLAKHAHVNININFHELPDDDEDLIVKGNEHLLCSAFINLMDNACKFSRSGNINVDLSFLNKKITVTVKDDGIGISKENMARIFEPFYRAPNARQIKGHGLGLPLTEKIVKIHNGSIAIDSKENAGTSITITLPTV